MTDIDTGELRAEHADWCAPVNAELDRLRAENARLAATIQRVRAWLHELNESGDCGKHGEDVVRDVALPVLSDREAGQHVVDTCRECHVTSIGGTGHFTNCRTAREAGQ